MPTYEYRCERCGDTVEVVQSFTDSPLTTCTSCGGPLRKVFAPVGIVFKGSGFYKTDSRARPRRRRRSRRPRSLRARPPSAKGTDTKGADAKGADKKESKPSGSSASKGDGATGTSAPPAATGAPKDGSSR